MTNKSLSLEEAMAESVNKFVSSVMNQKEMSEMDEEPSDDPLDFIYQSGGQLTRKEIEQRVQEYRRRKALQPTG